jgi:hypothetical protein
MLYVWLSYAVRCICVFDRRCQAGVIGGIIIAMLVFSIILPLILYYQRIAEYNTVQAETGIKYIEEGAIELLDARGLPYYRIVSTGYPVIEVSNIGSIPVTLKRIWLLKASAIAKIIDLTGDNNLIKDLYLGGRSLKGLYTLPTLQPGDTINITLNMKLIEAINYYFFVESDRGILHPRGMAQLLVPGGPEFGEPPNILGPSRLYFFSFRWYLYNSTDSSLTPWPDGYENYTIPVNALKGGGRGGGRDKRYDGIVFSVKVLNMDFYKRDITLDGDTQIWIYYSGSGGALQTCKFRIVSVDGDGNVKHDLNNPITIEYGKNATVYFLARSEEIPDPGRGKSLIGYGNLLIHGFVDSLPFSQNIPFVGITFVNLK